jgi:hypothetical protein
MFPKLGIQYIRNVFYSKTISSQFDEQTQTSPQKAEAMQP